MNAVPVASVGPSPVFVVAAFAADESGASFATSYAVHRIPAAQNNADQRLRNRRENPIDAASHSECHHDVNTER